MSDGELDMIILDEAHQIRRRRDRTLAQWRGIAQGAPLAGACFTQWVEWRRNARIYDADSVTLIVNGVKAALKDMIMLEYQKLPPPQVKKVHHTDRTLSVEVTMVCPWPLDVVKLEEP